MDSIEKYNVEPEKRNRELITASDGLSNVMNQTSDLSRNSQSTRSLNDIDRLHTGSICDFISAMPYKLSIYLLGSMDIMSILQLSQTSRHWQTITGDHDFWKSLFISEGWRYDEQVMNNYLNDGDISHCPLFLPPHHATFASDVSLYHYQPLFDRRYINWKRLYRNRMLIEKRWRNGYYRIHTLSTATTNHPGEEKIKEDEHWIHGLQYNDQILISGGKDRILKMWSMETAHCLGIFSGHTGSIMCLQFDGTRLFSGSSDSTIIEWDLSSGKKVQTLEGHSGGVLDLQFIGRRLVSGSRDSTIRLWDLDTGSTTLVMNGHLAAVNAIRFKDNKVVSGSGDRTIRLWNAVSGTLIRTFESHLRGIACIDFDGKYIISGSSDHTIKVFDSETGDCLQTLSGHTDLVRTLQWNPQLDRIISGSYDGTINIWNRKDGTLLQTLKEKVEKRPVNLKFDYSKIICSSNTSNIQIYNFAYDLDTLFLA